MSHITKIKNVKVTNLDILERACSNLGVELRRGQDSFLNFAGRRSECSHAVVVPENDTAYELGIVANDDGSFHFEMDNWDGGKGLCALVGLDASKLRQEYSAEASRAALEGEGFLVTREERDGKILLTARA